MARSGKRKSGSKYQQAHIREKISRSSKAVRCNQSAQRTIALLITSSNNFRKLSEKLAMLRSAVLLNRSFIMLLSPVHFLKVSENP